MNKVLPLVILVSAILVAIIVLLFSQSSQTNLQSNPDEFFIISTIAPINSLVGELVGGDTIKRSVLVPPGASPHTYEPTPNQLAEILTADALVITGTAVEFEVAWLDRIKSLNTELVIIDLSKDIDLINIADESISDPHIWLSPRNLGQMVSTLAIALSEIDLERSSFYQQQLATLLIELERIDEAISEQLVSQNKNTLLVYHDAWGYFARDYNLDLLEIENLGKEPTAKALSAIIKEALEKEIQFIFASPEFSTQSAKVIADQIGAKVITISPLSENLLESLQDVAKIFQDTLST
jgi:zinc transport system substrate-binding protein